MNVYKQIITRKSKSRQVAQMISGLQRQSQFHPQWIKTLFFFFYGPWNCNSFKFYRVRDKLRAHSQLPLIQCKDVPRTECSWKKLQHDKTYLWKMGKCSKVILIKLGWGWILQLQEIDLFSLYGLFSHFRPRYATLENSVFQMLSYARAHIRMTHNDTEGKFPWENHRG